MSRPMSAFIPAAVPELRGMILARSMPVATRVDTDQPDSDTLGRLVVRFTRFDSLYEINSWWEGRYMERVKKGAFRKTIRERGPKGSGSIKTLFDHGFDFHIGDKILGVPDDIREDDDFAVLEADLLDTSYNRDLKPGLVRGGYSASFMFNVLKDNWEREPDATDDNPEGLPIRTLTEIRLYEAGPVTFPANPMATAELNACRSGTASLYEGMTRHDPHALDTLRETITRLRAKSETSAEPFTDADGKAAESLAAEEPTTGHSSGMARALRAKQIREAYLLSTR